MQNHLCQICLGFLQPKITKIGSFLTDLFSGVFEAQCGRAQNHTDTTRLVITRHTASTSMYSLTFCVRFLLPERHKWKPAVQTAAVMLRTPPVGGRSPTAPAFRMRRAVLGAPPVARRSLAGGARRPRPDGRSHYVVISRDESKLVTRVRVMLP